MAFDILIPNYNGASLLEEYLPSVLDAVSYASTPCDIFVVDDGSTDLSADLLQNRFPEVRVLKNDRNMGFAKSVNRGMAACKHGIVVLLNNDVRIEKDFIGPLVKHFENEKVFAAVGKGLIHQDGVLKNESITKLEFKNGFLNLVQPGLLHPEKTYDEVCTVTHACGGFSAFDREKFLTLGGFDDLYYPFYWEDVDLCYRAWKRGWWVLYEPKSIAYHRSHATINKTHNKDYVDMLHVRNRLLFTWKNLTDSEMLIEHAHALNSYFNQAPKPFKQAIYEALKMIYDVLRRRAVSHVEEQLSDQDVIALSANRPIEQGLITGR